MSDLPVHQQHHQVDSLALRPGFRSRSVAMKVTLGPGEVIATERRISEHTESVMVADLISDPLTVPACLADRAENEVVGQLLYGSTQMMKFDTQVALVVGDVVMIPDDPNEYLVHRVTTCPRSNVEIYGVQADCDLGEPRGIRFNEPAIAEWHAGRELKRLVASRVQLVDDGGVK